MKNFLDHLIFVGKADIQNLRLLVPFLHVKRFMVVGGWWVLKLILVLSFKPKVNNKILDFQKRFCLKKFRVGHFWGLENFSFSNIYVLKFSGSLKISILENFGSKNFWVPKNFVDH